MPQALAPIDPKVADAIRRGDEAALEQLFRAEFSAMTQQADETLHDTRAATRAASKAIVDLWRARDSVESAAGMEALLNHALHEEVLDVHRRMASVHRHAKGAGGAEAVPTVDEAWAKVLEAIHPAAVNVEQRDAERIEQARHHAAEHLKALDGSSKNKWVAVVGLVVVLGIAGGAVVLLNRETESSRVSLALKSPQAVKIPTKDGQQGNVQLAGGGTALIGPASELTLPADFLKTVFALQITGTAKVKLPPTAQPMEVRAGNAIVVGAGTVTVRAFPDEDYVAVRLDEGAASLQLADTKRPLVIGEVVRLASTGVASVATGQAAEAALGWTSNHYVIQDVTLQKALLDVRRWFATQAQCNDKELLAKRVSIDIPLDSPRGAVEALAAASGASLGFAKGISVLYDPKRPI